MESSASTAPWVIASAVAGASPPSASKPPMPCSSDPFSSRMMRDAVFFPTPGILATNAASSCVMALMSAWGVKADSAASAILGPTPLTAMRRSNSAFSSSERNPYNAMPLSVACM